MIKKPLILLGTVGISLSLTGCFGIFAAGGAAAGNSAAKPLSLGTQVDDVTIQAKAINTLNHFPHLLNKSNVEVTVFDHIILLLGQVPTEQDSHEIAEAMSKIKNVRVVYNKLSIGEPVNMRTYAHDAWITTKVKAAFIGKVNPAAFDVVTEKGVVYLLGMTTPADGDVAASAASQVSGVREVVKAFFYLKEPKPAEIKGNIRQEKKDQ